MRDPAVQGSKRVRIDGALKALSFHYVESRSTGKITLYTVVFSRSRTTAVGFVLLNADTASESFVVAVVVRDGWLRVAPAVIAFSVVEVHEPETFRLQAECLYFCGPSGHDIAQRL